MDLSAGVFGSSHGNGVQKQGEFGPDGPGFISAAMPTVWPLVGGGDGQCPGWLALIGIVSLSHRAAGRLGRRADGYWLIRLRSLEIAGRRRSSVWIGPSSDSWLHELSQLGGATKGKGHGLCSVCWLCTEQGHRPAHPLPQLRSARSPPELHHSKGRQRAQIAEAEKQDTSISESNLSFVYKSKTSAIIRLVPVAIPSLNGN